MSTQSTFTLWPDGSAPIVERFTERTSVLVAFDGSEQRTPCRAQPRYELSGSFVLFDQEADALAALDAGAEVLVPAWPHGFATKAAADAVAKPAGQFYEHGGLFYPLFPARLGADSYALEIKRPGVLLTNLNFTSDAVAEPLFANAPTDAEVEAVLFHDYRSGSPVAELQYSANRFDEGNLATFDLRHTKKTLAFSSTLFGRNEIAIVRKFLLSKRGRAHSFVLKDPRDSTPRRWRMASDTWELRYLTAATAEVQLKLVEVAA